MSSPQGTEDHQHRPATLAEEKRFPLLPFFPLLLACAMITDSECHPDTIDLTDTHLQIKALSQCDLDGG